MPTEPAIKRTIAFVDGQNLYHTVKAAFGYTYPNYDVRKLALAVCAAKGWQLTRVQFYTGLPSPTEQPGWHAFWTKKLAALGRHTDVKVYSRPLVYRQKSITVPGYGVHTFPAAEEKGIDVRLALDVLDAAHRGEYDVALLFSQDQDLNELAHSVRALSQLQNRWIKIASAFATSLTATNKRGIHGTDWYLIDKAMYDACIDPRDYRK